MNTNSNVSFLDLKFASYYTIITIFILSFFIFNILGYILYRMQGSNYVVIVEIETDFKNSYFSFIERAIIDYENKIFIQKTDKKLEKNFIKKILYNVTTKKDFIKEFSIVLGPEIKEDLSNFQVFDIQYNELNSFLIKVEAQDLVIANKKIDWFIKYLKEQNFKIYLDSLNNYLSFITNAYELAHKNKNNFSYNIDGKELINIANQKIVLDLLCKDQEYSEVCKILKEYSADILLKDTSNNIVTYKNADDLLVSAGIKKNHFLNTDIIYEYKRDVYTSNFNIFTAIFIATLFSIFVSSFIIIILFLIYKIRNNE